MMNTYQEIQIMRQRAETAVLALLGVDFAKTWWNSSNFEFQGRTPEEMWMLDPQRVYQYLVGTIDGYW